MVMHTYDGEDNRPDYIAAGTYSATVVEAEEGISKAGNNKIQLKWQLDSPRWAVWDTLVFTANSKWKIDTFLVAVGMAPEKGKEIEINAVDLVGARAYIQVIVDPPDVNGKVWNSISKYITDKGLPPPLDADEPNSSNTASTPDELPTGDESKKPNLPF